MKKKKLKSIFLFINASKPRQLDVFLIKGNKVFARNIVRGNFKVTENLLNSINKILNKNKLKFKQLNGIINIIGPGPFTSLRIGVAVANTLAFALKIPVKGISNKDNISDSQLIKKGIKEISKARVGNYIQPFYNQEPNITLAKKY